MTRCQNLFISYRGSAALNGCRVVQLAYQRAIALCVCSTCQKFAEKPLRTVPLRTVTQERETAKYVTVRVNGQDAHFKVDIGAGDTVVSAICSELSSKLQQPETA